MKFTFIFKKIIPECIKLTAAKIAVQLGYKKLYSDCWLVSERGTDARDNGYYFFKYIKEQHPEISCFYVIDVTSVDYEKVRAFGSVVRYRSFAHYVAFLRAKQLISSHIMGYSPETEVFMLFEKHRLFSAKGKKVFLQHGIIKADIEGLKYPNINPDLFVCGAKKEFEYISSTYRHPKGVVQYTGLARYDTLRKIEGNREILFMPTWRKYLNSLAPSDYVETEYYRRCSSLLNDSQLLSKLEEFDYTLIFYPHYEMQKYLHLFSTENKQVKIATFDENDVQTLLRRADLLITDYSSVYFDIAYMNKPILFYQYDQKEFCERHYKKGYFDERSFGPILYEQAELVDKVIGFLEGNKEYQNYTENQRLFFGELQSGCCERIYRAITTFDKECL